MSIFKNGKQPIPGVRNVLVRKVMASVLHEHATPTKLDLRIIAQQMVTRFPSSFEVRVGSGSVCLQLTTNTATQVSHFNGTSAINVLSLKWKANFHGILKQTLWGILVVPKQFLALVTSSLTSGRNGCQFILPKESHGFFLWMGAEAASLSRSRLYASTWLCRLVLSRLFINCTRRLGTTELRSSRMPQSWCSDTMWVLIRNKLISLKLLWFHYHLL